MDKPRPCGCKGRRTCLICEKSYNIDIKPVQLDKTNSYVYCPLCDHAWAGWNVDINLMCKIHPNHEGLTFPFPGIYIDLNFLTDREENYLIKSIDNIPWDLSQSGRRKQNYGPKCNFKKKKLGIGSFNGFPLFSKFVQEKFKTVPILQGFQTIEQCSLEYDPDRGASIDPHVDDCWIWGERIVTVNLLADTVLTLTCNSKPDNYNLDCVKTYSSIVNNIDGISCAKQTCSTITCRDKNSVVVRVPMPRKSLLIMYGPARYQWEHQVLREDISQRRICLAYREFTPPYLENGENHAKAKEIFARSKNFW